MSIAGHIVVILVGNVSHVDGFRTPGQYAGWEQIVAQGMELTQWISNPIGSHSNYQALFGEYPFRNGNLQGFPFNTNAHPAPRLMPSLPHAMRQAGYATAMIGKLNIGRIPDRLNPGGVRARSGMVANLHGFDEWNAGIPTNVQPPASTGAPGTGYDDWERWDNSLPQSSLSNRWCDVSIGDEAVAWLDRNPSGKTFMVVSFAASHGPLSGTPPSYALPQGYVPGTLPPTEEHLLVADMQVERILACLDLSRDTVLFLSTCGSGAKSARDDRILTPAAVAGPSIPAGTICETIETPRDLWWRMSRVAGLPLPVGPDSGNEPYAYCDWTSSKGLRHRCVRTTAWKLMMRGSTEELYDLNADPTESNPIDPDDHEDAALVAQLRAWMVNP